MGWQKLVMIAAILTGCGTPETDTAPVDTGSAALPQPAVNAERSNPPIDQAGETGAIIVMLGDSLTAGFGLPSDQALPDQIGDRLEASGFKVQMVNSGVSGDTTAGGLARYDFSVAFHQPDLLILALGANDYLGGLAPADAEANLAAIIERAQGDGVPVVLTSVEARSTGIDDPRALAFGEIYPRLADTYDIPHFQGLLSRVRADPSLLLDDGLHPTAKGLGLIADQLAPFVAAYIPEP